MYRGQRLCDIFCNVAAGGSLGQEPRPADACELCAGSRLLLSDPCPLCADAVETTAALRASMETEADVDVDELAKALAASLEPESRFDISVGTSVIVKAWRIGTVVR